MKTWLGRRLRGKTKYEKEIEEREKFGKEYAKLGYELVKAERARKLAGRRAEIVKLRKRAKEIEPKEGLGFGGVVGKIGKGLEEAQKYVPPPEEIFGGGGEMFEGPAPEIFGMGEFNPSRRRGRGRRRREPEIPFI